MALGIFLLVFLLLSCSFRPIPVITPVTPLTEKEGWQVEWDKSLQEAGKEGKVVIYGSHGPDLRDSLSEAFQKSYGLNIEWVSGRSSELIPKIKAERRAGLFLGDVFITSSQSLLTIKDLGLLERLEKELILPEVTGPAFWMEERLPWVDGERFIIAPSQSPSYAYITNTQKVKASEVSSYKDLLNPVWKGRIASVDPRITGSRAWVVLAEMMGWDYVSQMAAQVRFAADQRQAVEWTAKGKTDITFSPGEPFMDFLQAGAPLEVIHPLEGVYLGGGGSALSLMSHRPHPHASRVFVNWYLSKEGQQFLSYTHGYMRKDLDTSQVHPSRKRSPGVKYFSIEREDWLRWATEAEKKLKEVLREIE